VIPPQDRSTVEQLRLLLAERVGYELPIDFYAFMARQAQSICHDHEIADLDALLVRLSGEAVNTPLWEHFISRMTIGESYLFRNPNHIKALRTTILPHLLKVAEHRPVHLWSAGCARGEEPYTLAIMLHELDPQAHERAIRIVATDIDIEALQAAKKRLYGPWAFRQTPYHIQRKYFSPQGKQLLLNPKVAAMVDFGYHHVAADVEMAIFPTGGFDLILCRNVLMYLRTDYRQRAGRVLAQRLAPGGFLIPGQVERLEGADDLLLRSFVAGSAIHMRKDAPAPSRAIVDMLATAAPPPPTPSTPPTRPPRPALRCAWSPPRAARQAPRHPSPTQPPSSTNQRRAPPRRLSPVLIPSAPATSRRKWNTISAKVNTTKRSSAAKNSSPSTP